MKRIKLRTDLIEAVASRAGQTVEEYVSTSRSISLGRRVCAHLESKEGAYTIFLCV